MSSAKPISTKTLNSMIRRLTEHARFLDDNKYRFGDDTVTLNELKNVHLTAIQRVNDILMTRAISSRAIDGVPQDAISYDRDGKPVIVPIKSIKRAPWEDQLEAGKLNPPSYLPPPIGKF